MPRIDNFDFDDINHGFIERYLIAYYRNWQPDKVDSDPICIRLFSSCPEIYEYHIDDQKAEDYFWNNYHEMTLRDIMILLWHSAVGISRTFIREFSKELNIDKDIVQQAFNNIMYKYIKMTPDEAWEDWKTLGEGKDHE